MAEARLAKGGMPLNDSQSLFVGLVADQGTSKDRWLNTTVNWVCGILLWV